MGTASCQVVSACNHFRGGGAGNGKQVFFVNWEGRPIVWTLFLDLTSLPFHENH